MATNANIIAGLIPLRWDGLLAPPYSLVSFGHENSLAERRVPYVDDAIHDDTGLVIAPMTARLMFLNTVEGGTTAGERNFPEYWNTWQARLDGAARNLDHPIYGRMRARVKGARGEVTTVARSGAIVEVTWVKTVEDPAILDFNGETSVGYVDLSQQAGAMAYTIGIYYPKGGNAAPAPTDLYDDLVGALSGAFSAARSAIAKVTRIIGRVGTMIDRVRALDTAANWPVLDALTRLWASLTDAVAALVRAARPTASRVIPAPTTLDAFARETGNSVADVMNLNVFALRTPIVPRGSTLTYYA